MSQTATRSLVCAHCGDECADTTISYQDNIFCCTGCRSVYEILQEHDLCDYYAIDDKAGVSQQGVNSEQDRFSVLNEPHVQSRFVEWSNDSTLRLRFEIPSMHCASCVWLLDKLHRFHDGVLRSEVDLMRKTVRVDIDTAATMATKAHTITTLRITSTTLALDLSRGQRNRGRFRPAGQSEISLQSCAHVREKINLGLESTSCLIHLLLNYIILIILY